MRRNLRILIFICFVLLVYGSLNLYALGKLALGLPSWPGLHPALALWGVAMVFAPFIIRFLRHHHWLRSETALSWVAFVWMGLVFLFCCLALAFDLIHVTMDLAGRSWPLTPARELHWTGLSALLLAGYGFFEASRLKVERIHIKTPKLKTEQVTLAQVSDMHLGAMLGEAFTARTTRLLQQLAPDMVIATGDIVDGKGEALHALTRHFSALTPPLGAYAILGNHEYFVGLDNSLRFLENAGFTVLRGETASAGGIILAGVDDRSLGQAAREMPDTVRAALTEQQATHYIVLLKHQPLVDDKIPFDLQLSGHLHGGQIFPFGFFSKLFYGVRAGMVRLSRGRLLYINRGTGTWGPPIRLFAPPEVTLITIERADAD